MLSLMDKHKEAYYHCQVAVKIAHYLIDDLIDYNECLAYRDSFSD